MRSWHFYFLFLLGAISNLMVLRYGFGYVKTVQIIALTAFLAYIETGFLCLLKGRSARKLLFCFYVIIHNVLLLTDVFINLKFHKVFDQDIIDIVAETNAREITEFMETYISAGSIFAYLSAILICNVILFFIAKQCVQKQLSVWIGTGLGLAGLVIAGYSTVSFMKYRNGASIPQYTSLTRVAYSCYILNTRMQSVIRLREVCKGLQNVTWNKADSTIYVLVIGESFSVYHSSIYGYEKQTNPLLQKRVDAGDILIYDDVITVDDHTHNVMKSLFSLSERERNFDTTPLFPACFKVAGYHTALYDNQYFVGNGITFLSDKKLSEVMFDERNETGFAYDGDMLSTLSITDRSLIVCHLLGQHYTYSDRYPHNTYAVFSPSEYSRGGVKRKNKIKYFPIMTMPPYITML